MTSGARWICSLLLLQLLSRAQSVAAAGRHISHAPSGFAYVVTSLVPTGGWRPPLLAQPYTLLWYPHYTERGRPIPGHARWSHCCGRRNYPDIRIVGGSDTKPSEFPWMAALVEGDAAKAQYCGGSLINDRYVLTAAHCLVPPYPAAADMQVILGKHARTADSGRDLRLDVALTIPHPLFNDDLPIMNDIGLVRLALPLNLPYGQNLVAPVCLPSRGDYPHSRVTAIGWGDLEEGGSRADRLQGVEMRTINNLRCGVLNAPLPITSDMICAGPKQLDEGGKDACEGDSGSPLMVVDPYRRRRYTVLGITSFGFGCGRPGRPGVYSRVTAFLDWIIDNTRDAGYC